MSLRNFKCDRCNELSETLFRIQDEIQKQEEHAPWYCPNCMRLMDAPLDRETLDLIEVLKQLNK